MSSMASPDIVERLIGLWDGPVPDADALRAILQELYTDPVRFNGVETSLERLAAFGRGFMSAYSERRTEVLSRMDLDDRVGIVLMTHARHTGVLSTPLGPVAPTGRAIQMQQVELFRLESGKIREIWSSSDALRNLLSLDVVALKAP
jgi:hypothetical protein